jgi:adenosylmethionine-8-amino-7-oxononanoate aminotransferase
VTPDELIALDRAHVWHPYGPMPGRIDPLVVTDAEGVRLRLADGRELVDGMASWWSAIHGYRHPVLDAAVRDQLGRMSHVMFGGLTHEPAVRLAAKLVEITPEPLRHVFLADSGSVSVEVAIKMCLQYWRSLGRSGKTRLLTWRRGYHGDTFHPMSVCDPEGGMHSLWAGVLPQQVFAEPPPREFEHDYVQHLVDLVEQHADELAAVIVEPVVQNAGGMRFHDPRYLHVLREVTLANGPTFMGNPLSSAVANASIDLLLGQDWRGEIKRVETGLHALEAARDLPGVADVRVLGAIGAVQLDHPVDMAAATKAAVDRGVWLRPFNDLIYTMPPYVIGDDDLSQVCNAIIAAATVG